MKILIATGLYPPESGGPATYTKLLEERLPAYGFEVSVLPFSTVRHLPKRKRHFAYFKKCLEMAEHADVVYAQDTVSVGFPAAFAAKMAGKKFVVRVPGDYSWEQARQRFGVTDELDAFQKKYYGPRVILLRLLQKFVVRRARVVIVPSIYMQRIVFGWGARSMLIYNGIGLPVPAIEPKGRPGGFLVVSAGRNVPWKGFEGLKRVVGREQNWHLFIADGLPRAEALGWAKVADVFVLNSTYEGLSHQLIEVMSLGTPIVATAVGGNPELITDRVEGLLIPPNNDNALYLALKDIEGNKEAARARGLAARARAGMFSIKHTLDQLAMVLNLL